MDNERGRAHVSKATQGRQGVLGEKETMWARGEDEGRGNDRGNGDAGSQEM